ncbi:PSD1 and planctomycete cytochrome C domain-containing protein [Agriterribacter sp.]|uniref:PSD1 and planctomycete cytochrome C domain-containing protein n=1 Tax=Agriterribacter sp. TaxID=2821509 RepID=UPI002B51A04D|nr:PSD1 and planctomycete cytochrome C domain-containing protein [Agriterribacter sp.]HTN08352.1 PSD1 and planctomycete cytochrome C domain-containing protein [Agriterribacter sp.]
MKRFYIVVLFCLVSGIALFTFMYQSGKKSGSTNNENAISYNFQVRPILSDKCYACHGPDANKREAGLRLDIREEAYKSLKDNPKAHAIVPGKPHLSELFIRVSATDTAVIMPPASSHLPTLTAAEVAVIKKWIEEGATYEPHWAFVTPQKPALPEIKNTAWPKNEIDHFVARKMEEHGLAPNEEADKERLLRRIALDITGLPPTPAQIDGFVKSTDPRAYEIMIDSLLQQPAYGERMAIPWLDVARFADSGGYTDDFYRSQWPWRDWVIYAFNKNLPYDAFVTWQLAGDLMPEATKEQILATGFNRNHKITDEGGVIDEEYRVEYVVDRTNTLGTAILGMTIECAKCHDHKYDPISQKNFFQLSAFFNSIKEVGLDAIAPAKNPRMDITPEDMKGVLSFITTFRDTAGLQVSVMKDMDTVRKTYVLSRGAYDQHAEEVQHGTPESIMAFPANLPKNRLGLSQWLFDAKNPLTARVFVNRIWQEIFGRGIVKSSNDFGMQGELPTNPQLLDWLAVDFRENGWNIKRLVKQIYMSATYRQSSAITPEKLKADPQNIYLSYAPRIRMNAEMIRDLVLASSGLLQPIIGGPSVKPYQPPGLWELATAGRGTLTVYKQDHGEQLYRRGMYTFIKRTVPPPAMLIFDASNRDQCEVKRARTNTPLQALIMMNDPTVLEASVALADELTAKKKASNAAVTYAFKRIINRQPGKQELDILMQYYKEQETYFKANPAIIEKVTKAGEYKMKQKSGPEVAALTRLVQVIYNMEEAITKT